MKKTKIIIPALAVLLLSTAASVSGTVAWFSMNSAVKVTGMAVKTKVSSSLQISQINQEANYSNDDLEQDRTGIIEPSSSIDARQFYWTTDAKANGDANHEVYSAYSEAQVLGDNPATTETTETNFDTNALDNIGANKSHYDKEFNKAYGFANPTYTAADPDASPDPVEEEHNVCYAYIDYAFYLKTYFAGTGEKIALSKCEMKYANGNIASHRQAWRVGLFAHEVASANVEEEDATTVAAGNLKSILAFQNSRNQNEVAAELVAASDSVALDVDTYFTDAQLSTPVAANTLPNGSTYYYKKTASYGSPTAVNSGTTLDAVTYGTEALVATSTASGTKRYRVVVRLWLEGEDVACTTETFATLTSDWSLDLEFSLGSDAAGVTKISTPAA